ncbi:acyl-CoA dehydrogenase [Streptomyces sp. NPDC086082]|uniref:acyl-CoA dehydrogenase n=1 Tax=Streptomyces sp. NPDC086082 TaxID=3365750 RepID=UPI0038239317
MTTDRTATGAAPSLRQLLHGESQFAADGLDGLLDTPPFKRTAPPCGPERHARTYDRLRALGEWVGGANVLHRDPARLLAALEWSATVDPPLFLAGTVQYAVCVAAMTELGRPGPYLAPLLDEVDRHETFGSIMITEVGRGNSHLATRTEARFDPATREFTLRTPDPAAAKFMSHVAGTGRTHMAIVYAHLLHGNQECGVFPFAVRIRDGDRITDGIRITELPETTSVPLNYALVTFDNTRVPYDGWLRDDASIAPDGQFTDPLGDPDRRLVRSLSVSSNASTGAAAALTAAARAAVTIGIRHSQHRLTMGRLRTDLPVLNYRTQQEALYGVLAEVYACSLLVARVKAEYVRRRSARADLSEAHRPVWAPWASVSREQALTKAAATRILQHAAGVCRERAGAQGLLTVNRLLEYEGLAQVYQAAAGDNLLIRLDAGKQLVEDLTHTVSAPTTVGDLVSPSGALALALLRERGLLTELRGRVDTVSVAERNSFETWNPLLPDLVTLADAHQQRLLLEAFATAVADAESPDTGEGAHLPGLHALHTLYALKSLEQTLTWHLECGSLTASDAVRVHLERDRALDAVHPHLAVLLDGFALPDARLGAPMAEHDVVAALFASGEPAP